MIGDSYTGDFRSNRSAFKEMPGPPGYAFNFIEQAGSFAFNELFKPAG
jgi:hypothetical protein